MSDSNTLPLAGDNQSYWDVSALEGGHITTPTLYLVGDGTKDRLVTVPSLAFILNHSSHKHQMLFDLGIRKDMENYTPGAQRRVISLFPSQVPQDVVDSLKLGGLSPEDITTICLSHLHWDHTGNTHLFPNAQFITGEGSTKIPTYPTDPDSIFADDILPPGRTTVLADADPAWKPVGPFPRALDFYQDGSLYIVDSPGHLPGHLNLLVRTSSDGSWVFLAGDTAHDPRVICCQVHCAPMEHRDMKAAEEHIANVQTLAKMDKVQVVLAHDNAWYAIHKDDGFWPAKMQPA